MSASFLINITETISFIGFNGIIFIILRYLDNSEYSFFHRKRYYQYSNSFFLNMIEARLIYILISIYLQFTCLNFSNFLNCVSSIFSFIFLAAFIFFLYVIGKILNSEVEDEDYNFRRVHHLIHFLDIEKHKITLNYRFINLIKKLVYFIPLIFMYSLPKTSIVMLIIISFLSFLFDLISRPFRFTWINNVKIISSLAWFASIVSIVVSYKYQMEMESSDNIIDD